jgi:hypothetical protein
MAAGGSRMELVDDVQFLRDDRANLLSEVKSLRVQSDLLRERNNELERKLRDALATGSVLQTQRDPSVSWSLEIFTQLH